MASRSLALVGCGNKKKNEPVEARSLYTSSYFQKKRQWAEGCTDWRIISAEYGLIQPETIIEPYDTVISDLNDDATREWASNVVEDLQPILSNVDEIIFLAGENYVAPIVDELEESGVEIRWPLEGKRIGEQIQWMGDNPPPDQSTFGSFE